ncbi:hypothetical protein GGR22_000720 [Flavobacterium gossypii]|uniref:Uncharacterized protein n=1 Tax=Flavobacterium gossypii TaxID=1646119 RepID=A0ABR6DLN4_9FLAO|nr:hypothetical protein [Flavobacterium gossypii]MBA9072594.1 hypothetical protein [Flavobacterium gossypii]
MEYTNTQIKEEYLRQAKVDFDKAKAKIEECFQENKGSITNKIELYEAVSICADKEMDFFRVTWLRTAPKALNDYLDYIDCILKIQNMYMELIKLPKSLISAI